MASNAEDAMLPKMISNVSTPIALAAKTVPASFQNYEALFSQPPTVRRRRTHGDSFKVVKILKVTCYRKLLTKKGKRTKKGRARGRTQESQNILGWGTTKTEKGFPKAKIILKAYFFSIQIKSCTFSANCFDSLKPFLYRHSCVTCVCFQWFDLLLGELLCSAEEKGCLVFFHLMLA